MGRTHKYKEGNGRKKRKEKKGNNYRKNSEKKNHATLTCVIGFDQF